MSLYLPHTHPSPLTQWPPIRSIFPHLPAPTSSMPGWLGLTFDFLGNLTLSSSLTALFLFLACYYVAPHHILKRRRATRSSCKTPDRGNTSRQGFTKTTDTDAIEPLHDFDIRVARPIQYRPYNTQGHVTMGLSLSIPSAMCTLPPLTTYYQYS